jgi:hypothetical protein
MTTHEISELIEALAAMVAALAQMILVVRRPP